VIRRLGAASAQHRSQIALRCRAHDHIAPHRRRWNRIASRIGPLKYMPDLKDSVVISPFAVVELAAKEHS